ncbi:hypothetical protein [Pseudoalteromonas sp. PPB1]|uniref:hypothetical protein n=1 Tax=Pseudoalteromonas sp. PPB1 TaxID=2756136 RepID=UPI001891626B|nr:hypothetical protein [Pseudoalteromonas sp. PPB1]
MSQQELEVEEQGKEGGGTYFLCPIEKVIPALVESKLILAKRGVNTRELDDVFDSSVEFVRLVGGDLGARTDKPSHRNNVLNDITEFLEKEGYIGKSTRNKMFLNQKGTSHYVQVTSFYLTGKGLDIYLKVQAHRDAEKRHNDTQRHNSMMRYMSLLSFVLAGISVVVATQTVKTAKENLELANKRYELSEKKFELTSQELLKSKSEATKPANLEALKSTAAEGETMNVNLTKTR